MLVTQSCSTLWCHGLFPARLLCPWTLPGKNTGVGCHYFSRGSSQPRDQIWFSCIAGRSFTIWVTRENLFRKYSVLELILTFPGNNLIIHQTLCHCKLCVRVDYRGFWPYKEIILNIQFIKKDLKWPTEIWWMHSQSHSCVQLFEAPWTIAHQAPLSMGFSR